MNSLTCKNTGHLGVNGNQMRKQKKTFLWNGSAERRKCANGIKYKRIKLQTFLVIAIYIYF